MTARRRLARSTQAEAGRRPRVFLVDDHRQVLDTLSSMLARDFDVVGVATDGRQAIDAARHANPDVIVLDVEMPGFDGFQTLRAFERELSPKPPVVFLSMHNAEDIIGEAFKCGGRGYVLKARAGRDLPSAIDQAILGRMFAPSLPSLFTLANGGGHAVQLHGDSESFLDGVAGFFDRALRHGDATCVIDNEGIREGLARRLQVRGWNVGSSPGHPRYRVVDAVDALGSFMRNGRPDTVRLAEIIAELDQYRLAAGEGSPPRLTIFGDLVVPLIADGNIGAVIEIEQLWTRLTQSLPFFTVCGYPMSCFHRDVPSLWSDVCDEHRMMTHASDV